MKNNRKGFTIVELVIVIAVIGILAGVLIPTFSSITASANQSAALQQAKSGLQSVLALTNGSLPEGTVFAVNDDDNGKADYKFMYSKQKLNNAEITVATPKQTVGANDDGSDYIVYVSSEAISAEKVLDATVLATLNDLFGTNESALTLSTLTDGSHYVATLGTNKVDIYFTSDIKSTLVIILGDMNASATPAPAVTTAPEVTDTPDVD